MKNLTFAFLLLLSILNVFDSKAQKHGTEQTFSTPLPLNVKIDGKADEWNNIFKLHNKSTNIYCTVANNSEFLYLTVQATDPLIMKKIIGGGVTFTICASGHRNDKNPLSITFPIISATSQSSISADINELTSIKKCKNKDSLTSVLNRKIFLSDKTIGIKGIQAINDTLISIYNNVGLKAAARVNDKNALTYELLIPFKLLNLSSDREQSIAYNIMLNGSSSIKSSVIGKVTVTDIPHGMATSGSDYQLLEFPTDYWARYTLAR